LKKILLGVIILIVFAGTGAYVYMQGAEAAKPGLENYVVEDTDVFVYLKDQEQYKDLEKRYTKAFEKYIEKSERETNQNLENNLAQLQEIDKYIKDMALVHTSQSLDELNQIKDANLFLIINAGKNFDLARPFIGNMFEKTENENYILKEEFANNLKTPELIRQVGDFDIYLKMADRYFIFAFDENKLDDYYAKVKSGSKDDRIISKYNEQKKDIFEIYALIDGNKLTKTSSGALPPNEFIESIGDIELYSIFKNKNYQIEFGLEGKGKIFELIDSSKLKNRNINEYLNYNSMYLSNNDLGNTLNEVNEIMKATSGMDYNVMVQMFTGHTLEEVSKSLGNELIISVNEDKKTAAIIDLKDTEIVEESLKNAGVEAQDNKYSLGEGFIMLDDKKLFYNNENKKTSAKIEITNEDFLVIPVDLGKALKMIPEMQLEMMLAGFAENLIIEKEELKTAVEDVKYNVSANADGTKLGFKMAMADQDIRKLMNYAIKVLEDSSK